MGGRGGRGGRSNRRRPGGSSSGGSSTGIGGSGSSGSGGASGGRIGGGGNGSAGASDSSSAGSAPAAGNSGSGSIVIGGSGGSTLTIQYGPGLTEAERMMQEGLFSKVPRHIKDRLFKSGTKVWVGRRADETPGWGAYAEATGRSATSLTADGREYGTLSFYNTARNELFISTDALHGSVNVYVHELGHAVDFQWLGDSDYKVLSSTPEWRQLHNENIRDNPNIDPYFRGGVDGRASSGRTELFAEGLAIYNELGLSGLTDFVAGDADVAARMVEIWRNYGVINSQTRYGTGE